MKYTLLQMTQDILSSMSSDEVNSVSDTTESLQVATIIKQKYFDIINRLGIPDHEQLIQLQGSTDPTQPVLMYVPPGISDIKYIKYFDSNTFDGETDDDFQHDLNVDLQPLPNAPVAPPGYLYVTILPIKEFLNMINSFNPNEDNIETFTFSDTSNAFNGSYTFYYKNNKQPQYCTILSNYYVIFDGYDNTQDSTLQSSKTMAFGSVIPSWSMADTFIPDLAEEQFPLLLNEAKALAFFELKQQPHQLAVQEANRGWSNIQKQKAIVNRPTYFDELPDFGRRRAYYGYRGTGLSGWRNNGW